MSASKSNLVLFPLNHQASQSSLMSSTTYHSVKTSLPSPAFQSPHIKPTNTKEKERPSAINMVRTDSGYADSTTIPSSSKTPPPMTITTTSNTQDPESSRRSSSSRRSAPRKQSHAPSSPTTSSYSKSSRPRHTRAPASQTSRRSSRPSSDQTHRYHSAVNPAREVTFAYFQFPELSDDNSTYPSPPTSPAASVPASRRGTVSSTAAPTVGRASEAQSGPEMVVRHVPATVQYWTSSETRKREYAAIDAASKGVKGFCLKLLPECLVPREYKVLGFTEREEGAEMSERGRGNSAPRRSRRGRGEEGSVRRYRISLDEGERGVEKGSKKAGWWRLGGSSD